MWAFKSVLLTSVLTLMQSAGTLLSSSITTRSDFRRPSFIVAVSTFVLSNNCIAATRRVSIFSMLLVQYLMMPSSRCFSCLAASMNAFRRRIAWP